MSYDTDRKTYMWRVLSLYARLTAHAPPSSLCTLPCDAPLMFFARPVHVFCPIAHQWCLQLGGESDAASDERSSR